MPEFIRSRLGNNAEAATLGRGLQALMEAAEAERAGGLEAFRGLAAASQVLFQHEHARLLARLGPEHPRVHALAARLRAVPALAAAAEAALGEARAREPAARPDRAVLHGRVVDPKSRGLEDLTVAWEDERGQPLRALGEVRTDASGAFTAELAPEALAALPVRGAFLAIRNAGGALLHREAAPLKPALGARAAVRVVLDRLGKGSSSTVDLRAARPDAGPLPKDRPPQETWTARGHVTGPDGKGAPGLLVTALDQDVLFDDTLGASLTGADGAFSIAYGHREFREKEAGPDLYLRVSDASGRELHRTPVRREATRDEVFVIRLGGVNPPGEAGRGPERPVAPAGPEDRPEGPGGGAGGGGSGGAAGGNAPVSPASGGAAGLAGPVRRPAPEGSQDAASAKPKAPRRGGKKG